MFGFGFGASRAAVRWRDAYAPIIARPIPTGTIRSVNTGMTASAIKAQYDACNSGDCLEFDDGTYDQPAIFTAGYNRSGVIIRAKNWGPHDADPFGGGLGAHWARFTRKVIFEMDSGFGGTTGTVSAADVTIHDICFTTPSGLWPADGSNWSSVIAGYPGGSGRGGYITLGTGAARFRTLYNEFWTGYGSTKLPFDPSTSNNYYDYTAASGANRLLEGPVAVQAGNYKGDSFTAYGNYCHDMTGGFHNIMPGSGTLLIQHNWDERIYHDFTNMLGQTGHTTIPTIIRYAQNIGIDPFSDSADTDNPHQDLDQLQFQHTNGGTQYYVSGIFMDRNIIYVHETTRGTGVQLNFAAMVSQGNISSVKVVSRAIKQRENFALMSGTSHAGDTGVTEHPYIRGNVAFHPLLQVATPTTARITWSKTNGYAVANVNKGYYSGNVLEKLPSGNIFALFENNYHIGIKTSRAIADATIFQGNWGTYPVNLYEAYEKSKRTASYAAAGMGAVNIRGLALGPLDFTGETPFAGFVTQNNATPSSTITSELSWLHGGDTGDTHTITPGASLEMQTVLASDRTTIVQAWTSSPITGVQTDNHLVQARGTSAAQDGAVSYSYTIDSKSFTWPIISTATAYSTATFDATANVSQPSNAASGSDSQKVTFGIEMAIAANPASAKDIWGVVSGTAPLRIQVISNGKLRFILTNSSGSTIASIDVGTALTADGVMHRYLVSIDLSQPVEDGLKIIRDGNEDLAWSASTWNSGGGDINFAKSIRRRLGGANAFTFRMLHMLPGVALDVTDPLIQAKYNQAQALSDGSGVDGSQPPIFLVGDATKLNSATEANYGSTHMTFTSGSGSIT